MDRWGLQACLGRDYRCYGKLLFAINLNLLLNCLKSGSSAGLACVALLRLQGKPPSIWKQNAAARLYG